MYISKTRSKSRVLQCTSLYAESASVIVYAQPEFIVQSFTFLQKSWMTANCGPGSAVHDIANNYEIRLC